MYIRLILVPGDAGYLSIISSDKKDIFTSQIKFKEAEVRLDRFKEDKDLIVEKFSEKELVDYGDGCFIPKQTVYYIRERQTY